MYVPRGVTDLTIFVQIIDDAGLPVTGLDAASFPTIYLRHAEENNGTVAAGSTLSLTDLADIDSAHSDGGLFEDAQGFYRLDLPDDVGNSDTTWYISGEDTDLHLVHAPIDVGYVHADVRKAQGTAVTASGGRMEVNTTHAAGTAWGSGAITAGSIASNAITSAKLAADAIGATQIATGAFTAAKFASGAFDAVWSVATRLLTAGTNIALAKGTGVTGFNDLDAAGVRNAVGLNTANLDTQISGVNTNVDSAETTIVAAQTITDLKVDSLLARLGGWTGTGINTVLGAFRALAAKASALTPSNISSGTTFDNTTDSLEAIKDSGGGGGGGGLSAQETRDAMQLAPTDEGDTATGSVDDKLNKIKLKTDLLGTGRVTISAPLSSGGRLELYQGDDYSNTDGRSIELTNADGTWPDLTGASIEFRMRQVDETGAPIEVAGSVVTPTGANQKVRAEPTSTFTSQLTAATEDEPLNYRWIFVATLSSGRVVTLGSGLATVKEDLEEDAE
jgi:hypothetical protein